MVPSANNVREGVHVRPVETVFVLAVIETMAEPYTPYDIEVRTDAGHDMPISDGLSLYLLPTEDRDDIPPPMPFKEDTPRKANISTPATEAGTEIVIQIPDPEPPKKHAQSIDDHKLHSFQNRKVSRVFGFLSLLRWDEQSTLLASQTVFFRRPAPSRTESDFHRVHTPHDDDDGQDGKRILVEDWVLQVMVVQGDEDSQASEGSSQVDAGA